MTRADDIAAIKSHLESALFIADGLPTTIAQQFLRDTLVGAMQEIYVLYPEAEQRREKATR